MCLMNGSKKGQKDYRKPVQAFNKGLLLIIDQPYFLPCNETTCSCKLFTTFAS